MDKIFLVIAGLAMVGVVFSLVRGVSAMGGTKKDHETSQKMMQWRIKFQAIALLSLFVAYLSKH